MYFVFRVTNPQQEGEFRISVADVAVLPIGHIDQRHYHLTQTHQGAIDTAGLLKEKQWRQPLLAKAKMINIVKLWDWIHGRSVTLSRESSVCVSFCLSDPARSTRFNWDIRMFTTSLRVSLDSKVMVNTAWDLEDSRFMEVEATRRLRQPIDNT